MKQRHDRNGVEVDQFRISWLGAFASERNKKHKSKLWANLYNSAQELQTLHSNTMLTISQEQTDWKEAAIHANRSWRFRWSLQNNTCYCRGQRWRESHGEWEEFLPSQAWTKCGCQSQRCEHLTSALYRHDHHRKSCCCERQRKSHDSELWDDVPRRVQHSSAILWNHIHSSPT